MPSNFGFSLIQMHCRVLVMGFSRDMSGSRDAVASCETVWPALCSPVSHKEKQSAATAPVSPRRLFCRGSWQALAQPVKQRSVCQKLGCDRALYISHRKHKQIFYHSEKYTYLSTPQNPQRITYHKSSPSQSHSQKSFGLSRSLPEAIFGNR